MTDHIGINSTNSHIPTDIAILTQMLNRAARGRTPEPGPKGATLQILAYIGHPHGIELVASVEWGESILYEGALRDDALAITLGYLENSAPSPNLFNLVGIHVIERIDPIVMDRVREFAARELRQLAGALERDDSSPVLVDVSLVDMTDWPNHLTNLLHSALD